MLEHEKEAIINILEERKANVPCPRCDTKKFTLLDGYITQTMQTSLNGIESIFNAPSITMICVICNNCGFLSYHALGCLGLLPKDK